MEGILFVNQIGLLYMVIEWLKFQVPSHHQIHFLEQDLAIWTQALAQQPGFVGKEVWVNPAIATELILVIRWRTHAQWQAICPVSLASVEAQFREAVGEQKYQMIETGEYQVHRLPHIHVNLPAYKGDAHHPDQPQ